MAGKPMTFGFALDGEYARELPPRIDCRKCGEPLITVSKLPLEKRVSIDIHFSKPPIILNAALNKGRCRCDRCGAKNSLDLRLFRAARPPTQ